MACDHCGGSTLINISYTPYPHSGPPLIVSLLLTSATSSSAPIHFYPNHPPYPITSYLSLHYFITCSISPPVFLFIYRKEIKPCCISHLFSVQAAPAYKIPPQVQHSKSAIVILRCHGQATKFLFCYPYPTNGH